MKLVAIVVGAYVVAAAYYVWRDLAEQNFIRWKPYIFKYRRTGERGHLLVAGAWWIVGVLANARMKGRLSGKEIWPLAIFVATAALLWLISN